MSDSKTLVTAAGVTMPRIIYGTAWKKERTKDLVVAAVRAGFSGIDTAGQPRHYEEPLVGAALAELSRAGMSRESVFLQTKFTPLAGQDPANIPYDADAPLEVQIEQSVAASLANLQTTYLDSLILHSPLASHALSMRAWKVMESICADGRVRQLGISNCYDLGVLQALFADAEIKPAVVQNRFYAQTGYDAPLRQWCADHAIVYQGFWTLTANPHLLVTDVVQRLSRSHGRTEAQIFLRFLTQLGIVPLTGTTSAHHMRENLDIFSFSLAQGEMGEMLQLLGRG